MSVSKLVEKIDADVFLESLSKLDAALKDILSSSIGGDLIEKIVVKYEVNLYHLPDLMMLFGLYVTKLIAPQEFIDYLATFVPQKYFPQFLQELEDKLWSPYDVYLNKAGVVYKQLTKLTPAPLSNVAGAFDAPPVVEEPTSAPAQLAQEQVQSGKQPSVTQLQPITTELPVTQLPVSTELPPTESRVLDNVGAKIPEPPVTQLPITNLQTPPAVPPVKPVIISDIATSKTPATFDVAPAGEKTMPVVPTSDIRYPTSESGQARVKFDEPRVGPRIFKPTESAITPKASEVKFVGPEIKPEVSANVPPASSQWQRPEEKKVEIPKPPEVKKTEVQGREVIDLTNFGLSKPDED